MNVYGLSWLIIILHGQTANCYKLIVTFIDDGVLWAIVNKVKLNFQLAYR